MRRILVIGSGGAGKSTLARQVGARISLPVIHLDAHYWQPGWVEPTSEAWSRKVGELIQGEAWVMDGNYGGTLDVRIAAADTIIFLSLSRWRCLGRVLRRRLRFRNRSRPDMAKGCPERITWAFVHYILLYPTIRRPRIMEKLAAVRDRKQVVVLETPRHVEHFLQGLVF